MPITVIPDDAQVAAASSSTPCSSRQGTHHGAQKLTTRIEPSIDRSEIGPLPSIALTVTLGTGVSMSGEGARVGSLPNREVNTTASTATTSAPAPAASQRHRRL